METFRTVIESAVLAAPRSNAGSRMTTTVGRSALPDERGYFGAFGGRYVPETLMPALSELEEAYADAREDARPSARSSSGCCATSSAGPRRSRARTASRGGSRAIARLASTSSART